MSFYDILSLLGGLAMFLYGMRLMGDSLKENSSGTLKLVMEKATDNSIKAFLLGIAITALIQSSTATIVITSGLVGAGILTLRQSLGIIVGANVGTTVTGQIIRLLDLDTSGGSSMLRIFQPSTLAPIALIIGILLMMTGMLKNKSIGNIAIGFGILFSGLLSMTSAVKVLQSSGTVDRLFAGLGDNPVLGYLTGAGVAFALQSSSAAIGIMQAFSATGLLTFRAIYSVIVGIYLGDCVTTAIVCYIGASRDARRVGIVNILFNLSKSVLVLAGVTILHHTGALDALWDRTVNSGIIANTNTVFNLACAICLFPMLGTYEKMSDRIVRKKREEKDRYDEELNPVFFATPALALRSCYDTLNSMFGLSRENLKRAEEQIDAYDEDRNWEIETAEREVDRLTDRLSRYLVELLPHLQNENHVLILNQYYKVSTEFERLGDLAVHIADIAKNVSENEAGFSDKFKGEIKVLQELIGEILNETEKAFAVQSVQAAARIEPKVRVVTEIINGLTQNHLRRMGSGECSMMADAFFSNLMGEYKRIAGICSNVGIATLVRARPELAEHEHLFFETLNQSDDGEYKQVFDDTYAKYSGRLAEPVPGA